MQDQAAEARPCPTGRGGLDACTTRRQSGARRPPFTDYFPLFDDEKKVLGGDLVSREEKELFPGQTMSLEVPFAAETRFIALAGGYHDAGSASWRAIAPAPGSKGRSVHVMAVAERTRVTVSVTP